MRVYKSLKLNQNLDIALCYEALRLLKLVMGKYEVSEGHALMALFYFSPKAGFSQDRRPGRMVNP